MTEQFVRKYEYDKKEKSMSELKPDFENKEERLSDKEKANTEKTNANSLLGKSAVVIQEINDLAQTGQVRINDIEWMARTSDDSVTIPVDTVVIIKAVHGVKLIVEPKEA